MDTETVKRGGQVGKRESGKGAPVRTFPPSHVPTTAGETQAATAPADMISDDALCALLGLDAKYTRRLVLMMKAARGKLRLRVTDVATLVRACVYEVGFKHGVEDVVPFKQAREGRSL